MVNRREHIVINRESTPLTFTTPQVQICAAVLWNIKYETLCHARVTGFQCTYFVPIQIWIILTLMFHLWQIEYNMINFFVTILYFITKLCNWSIPTEALHKYSRHTTYSNKITMFVLWERRFMLSTIWRK